MTEAEWLAATNPHTMLTFLEGKASERKLRLFACFWCYRIWHLLADGTCHQDVFETAGLSAEEAVAGVVRRYQERTNPIPEMFVLSARAARMTTYADFDAKGASAVVSACSLISRHLDSGMGSREVVKAESSATLREMFGNPFRPLAFSPEWRTSTVLALARQMYESRDFSPMPILADALQDTGCDNDNILNHCRGPGPHSRGCFIIDQILGKE
jgi:hypothetical protein